YNAAKIQGQAIPNNLQSRDMIGVTGTR
ncbi:unnamed protein product, partial [Rotaria sp. Silwood1]